MIGYSIAAIILLVLAIMGPPPNALATAAVWIGTVMFMILWTLGI